MSIEQMKNSQGVYELRNMPRFSGMSALKIFPEMPTLYKEDLIQKS